MDPALLHRDCPARVESTQCWGDMFAHSLHMTCMPSCKGVIVAAAL
jgi:hypothetical protein